MVKRMEKSRSSCPEVFYKKGVLKKFAEFTALEGLFNRVTGLRCFHVNFPKFLRILIL